MQERLQKILSRYGICARRKAEDLIRAGHVSVNGEVAAIGQKADIATDRVEVDGEILKATVEKVYYLMYKPVGVETTNANRWGHSAGVMVSSSNHDTQGGVALRRAQGDTVSCPKKSVPITTVYDLLPPPIRGKVFPVGRLDKESEGLLLFTNDGELKYRLEHPKFDHEKEYEVETAEQIFDGALKKLEKGLMVDGTKTKPARVTRLGPSTFRIALTEGRNRQIRRMCQKVGSAVVRLRRVRIMRLCDDALQEGNGRMLTGRELAGLLEDTA